MSRKPKFSPDVKKSDYYNTKFSFLIAQRSREDACDGKTIFNSYAEAREVIDGPPKIKRTIAYICPYCHQWHIGDKPGKEEMEKYELSADQSTYEYAWKTGFEHACDGKFPYSTKLIADIVNKIEKIDPEMQSYPCPYCKKWHLGHVRGKL